MNDFLVKLTHIPNIGYECRDCIFHKGSECLAETGGAVKEWLSCNKDHVYRLVHKVSNQEVIPEEVVRKLNHE